MKNIIVVAIFTILIIPCAFSQDLVIIATGGTNTATQYGTLSVTATIKNQGIVDIVNKNIQTRAYLSIDETINSNDQLLDNKSITGLAVNAEASITLSTSSVSLIPGVYNLIIKTDYTNAVAETDETNNQVVVSGYVIIAPDIDFSIASLTYTSTTVAAFDYFYLSYTIQNSGSTPIASIYTAFYLSQDNILDASDTRLITISSGTGSAKSGQMSVSTTQPGNYYLIARVDDTNGSSSYTETDETNNINIQPVIILPSDVDLEVITSPAPTVLFDEGSQYLETKFKLRNNGTTSAIGYTMSYYLSYDQYLDEEFDFQLFNSYNLKHPSYYAEASKTIDFSIGTTIDSYLMLDGYFYVIIKFNPDQSMSESNYDNNLMVSPMPVLIRRPQTNSLLSVVLNNNMYNDKDKTINLTATFTNHSEGSINDYALYSVRVKNSSGTTVYNTALSEFLYLYPGQDYTTPFSLSLSNPLPSGNYNIEFSCSAYLCGNEKVVVPLVINQSPHTLNGSIQTEDGTLLDKGKLFLYQKDINGIIKFTQKVDPISTSNFSFQVDSQPYTLYFIPDPLSYPNAVPTIWGKTMLLNDNSFLQLTKDTAVTLTVIEIQPLSETGEMIISGTVTSGNPGGRVETITLSESFSYLPVILLSENGNPLAITYTDESGYYEFNNLPAGIYGLVLSLPLDEPQLSAPIVIDLSLHHAKLDFDLQGSSIATNLEILQLPQLISFDAIPEKTFGDESFQLAAETNSGLVITYVSSEPQVAIINENNEVHIVGAGTTTITAHQGGNTDFLAAEPVEQVLTVNKAEQFIQFDPLPEKESNQNSFALNATSTSSLEITYSSDDEDIVSIQDNLAFIHGAGTVNITAAQKGNSNYHAASPVTHELLINLVTGIENPVSLQPYPNPTRDLVKIPSGDLEHVILIDVIGNVTNVILKNQYLDLSQHAAGVYMLKFYIGDEIKTMRIVKE